MNDIFLSDPAGHRVAPSPQNAQPKETQTALKLIPSIANTNYSVAISAAKTYNLTNGTAGTIIAGFNDVISAAGNVRWVCPAGQTVRVCLDVAPSAAATRVLHFASDGGAGSYGYLVEVEQ